MRNIEEKKPLKKSYLSKGEKKQKTKMLKKILEQNCKASHIPHVLGMWSFLVLMKENGNCLFLKIILNHCP